MTSILRSVLHNKKILFDNVFKSGLRLEHEGKVTILHRCSDLEKRFLVWTKRYPNIKDVPNEVPNSVMDRCRNKMRIKICNYMMIFTIIGCVAMIITGKRAAARGDNLPSRTIEWHKKLREEAEAEKKAALK